MFADSKADCSPQPLAENNNDVSNFVPIGADAEKQNEKEKIGSCNGLDNGINESSHSSSNNPSRSQSVLNLTASALAGIFQPPASPALPEYDGLTLRDPRWATPSKAEREAAGQAVDGGSGRHMRTFWREEANVASFTDVAEDSTGYNIGKTPNSPKKYDKDDCVSRVDLRNDEKMADKEGFVSSKMDCPSWQPKSYQLFMLESRLKKLTRLGLLFILGVAYGLLVSRLHDGGKIAPVQVQGIDRNSSLYFSLWGCAGILLGIMMPQVDALLTRYKIANIRDRSAINLWDEWYAVARSIGAFVGVAFAIRKLPWQSTLQLSVTLALANPALWYLLDRSFPGMFLSLITSFLGTVALVCLHPGIIPPVPRSLSSAAWDNPSNHIVSADREAHGHLDIKEEQIDHQNSALLPTTADSLPYEQIGAITWIASVLFCSCVCLGNVGRRLSTNS